MELAGRLMRYLLGTGTVGGIDVRCFRVPCSWEFEEDRYAGWRRKQTMGRPVA